MSYRTPIGTESRKEETHVWADASEGIFISAYVNPAPIGSPFFLTNTIEETMRGGIEAEVLDLSVHKSLHSSRTEDRYALEEADQRAAAIDASTAMRAAHECKSRRGGFARRRAEHAAAIAAAAAREAERACSRQNCACLCRAIRR